MAMTPQQLAVIEAIKQVEIAARKLAVNLMYIVDCGDEYELESTGSPTWTSEAADTLTALSEDLLQEDERQIDKLFEDLFDNEMLN